MSGHEHCIIKVSRNIGVDQRVFLKFNTYQPQICQITYYVNISYRQNVRVYEIHIGFVLALLLSVKKMLFKLLEENFHFLDLTVGEQVYFVRSQARQRRFQSVVSITQLAIAKRFIFCQSGVNLAGFHLIFQIV